LNHDDTDAEPDTAAASGSDDTAAAPTEHVTELIETGAAPTPELAWSDATEEQETEAISEKPSRALWLGPVMALLAAAIAVASAMLFYTHRAPAPNAPVPTPPSASARPAPPPPNPPHAPTTTIGLPTTTSTTTSTPAVASGPAIGEPCNHWSKIARDPNTGLTIICDGGTGRGATPHWTTDDLSHVIGVETIGTSCAGTHRPFEMAISPDDYLVACTPADAGVGQLAGPGSTWQIYHP
jgi:hypothetical protein